MNFAVSQAPLGNPVREAPASRNPGKLELAKLGSQRGRWEPEEGIRNANAAQYQSSTLCKFDLLI